MKPRRCDVAIIGCGPAGAALANFLGHYGLAVVVLEKDADIYPLPRAIHFDGEVMRVFETLGLRAEVETISRPGLTGMHFNNAQGETLLIRGGTSAQGPHGCATNHYFHQPELEVVLRNGLRRYPSVQLLTQHEVTHIDAADDGSDDCATLQVSDIAGGRTFTLQASYVVGCDGARSLVRKVINTPMIDLGLHQPWLVFDALLNGDVPTLPRHTVQHCDPQRPMTYCNVTGNRRRWEIMLMPGDDPQAMVEPAQLWQLVSPWITPEQARIERAVIYTFHSIIAKVWRRGRLFLAGDAAHQTPPFLGQGLCAAVRDVANLAWKLVAVVRGRADDALLDTYELERSPHVHAFIDLAVKLGNIIQTTDPQAARERDAQFKAGQPTIFEFPSPRLGEGVWQGGAPQTGRIFPQPRLTDGRLLDANIGQNFAVIALPGALEHIDEETQRAFQENAVVRIDAQQHPELAAWLAAAGAIAVLIRPDRYVAGVAKIAAELDQISICLPRQPRLLHRAH